MVSMDSSRPGNGDAMAILIDMNGKIGSIGAQLNAIQLQLASDKVEHNKVHDDINKKLDEFEEELLELRQSRDEIQVRFDQTKRLYMYFTAFATSAVAIWAVIGDSVRGFLGTN